MLQQGEGEFKPKQGGWAPDRLTFTTANRTAFEPALNIRLADKKENAEMKLNAECDFADPAASHTQK